MASLQTCPRCGTKLPTDAPRGSCPACLLLRGLSEIPLVRRRGAAAAAPAEPAGSPSSLIAGLRFFGDYEVLEEIARGGMGVVYRARQLSLNRIVALKTITAGRLATPLAIARFHTETEAVALLDHPNIVPIYQVGDEAGGPYFSMKLIEGGSLAIRLSNLKSQISNADAAKLMSRVARAVHHAHQRGILHRDLKPGNILLDADGQPYVTDFGLAKLMAQDSSLTQSLSIIGTPSYMAPEQAAGRVKHLSTATDIYSLGAILYELLAGRPPFTGGNELEILWHVMEDEPVPPSAVCRQEAHSFKSEIDRDLETICMKCLNKSPAHRYGSAEALALDLDHWLAGETISARPARPPERVWRWCRRKPVLAGALAALLAVFALGFTGVLWQWRRANGQATEKERERRFAVQEGQRADLQRRAAEQNETSARLNLYAADMNLVQQAWAEGNLGRARSLLDAHRPGLGQTDLRGFEWRYFWKLCQGESLCTLRGHSYYVTSLAFSPDGTTFASGSRDQTVKLWNVVTREGIATLAAPTGQVAAVAFSRDGRTLAAGSDDGQVRLWDIAAQKITATFRADVDSLAFSSVGNLLAVGGGGGTWGGPGGDAQLWDYAAGKQVMRFPKAGSRVAFSPDGITLAIGSIQGIISIWNVGTRQKVKTLSGAGQVTALGFSPDGETLAVGNHGPDVQLWSLRSGRMESTLRGHAGRIICLAYSPDGRKLATTSVDHVVRVREVATGLELARLTGHEGEVWAVAFSPDGRVLASGSKDDSVKLWSMEAPLPGVAPPPGNLENIDVRPPTFSPDASLLAVGGRGRQIELWNMQSNVPPVVLKAPPIVLGFAPDGQTLVTATNPVAFASIRRWEVGRPGVHQAIPLSPPAESASWISLSPDSQLLAVGRLDGVITLWDTATGRLQGSLSGHQERIWQIEFAPDQRTLASCGHDRTIRLWRLSTLREWTALKCPRSGPYSLCFAPDGATLMSGHGDGTVRLWDLSSGREIAALTGHKEVVFDLALSPDGRTLASTSQDATVKLWNLATRREVATFRQARPVNFLTFSADGRALAMVGLDKTLSLWRAPSLAETDRVRP